MQKRYFAIDYTRARATATPFPFQTDSNTDTNQIFPGEHRRGVYRLIPPGLLHISSVSSRRGIFC